MDVEEFFRDEDLEAQSPWEPDRGNAEWMPNVPLEEAPDNIETVLGSRCYRGRFFGKQEYLKSYVLREDSLADIMEKDIVWSKGPMRASLLDIMTDYTELLRSNAWKGPRVLFHFVGNVRAIILRLMQPVRYITLETWNMRDFVVRRGIGMPIERMKRMPQISVGATRYSISIVAAGELSSDFGYDVLPPKVMDALEAHVARDYHQVFVRGTSACVTRMDGMPVWFSREFMAFDDGTRSGYIPSFCDAGKARVALFGDRSHLPAGMLVDGDPKWTPYEVTQLMEDDKREDQGISGSSVLVTSPVGGTGPRLKGKKNKKNRRKAIALITQDAADVWTKLNAVPQGPVGPLDDGATYKGKNFIAYSREHARVNGEKVVLLLASLRHLLGSIFVIAPGDGIGVASRVCASMGVNGIFGDAETCEYTATNVKKEQMNDTLLRGWSQAGCSVCRRWSVSCSQCKEKPIPVIIMSYVMAFLRERTVWTTLVEMGVPTIIIDSPYRVPYAPAMRKQAGVWVINSSYPSRDLWTTWQAPIVTHPRGYFVPYTNALVEPRRWGYVEDTASLLYLASVYPGSEVSNYSVMSDDQVRGFLGNLGLRFAERSDADIILVNQDHDNDFEGRWRLDLRTGHYSRGEAYVPFDPMLGPSSRSLHRGSIYIVDCGISSVVGPVGYRKTDTGHTTFWCMDLRGQTKATVVFRSPLLVSRIQLVFHGD